MRFRKRLAVAGALIGGSATWLAVFAACSDGSDDSHKSHLLDPPDTGNSDSPAVDAADAKDASPVDVSQEKEAATAVCNPAAMPRALSLVQGVAGPLVSNGSNWLGSITDDQLSVAWMSGADPNGVLHFADRASTSVPFGAPQTLDQSVVGMATDRVALSNDGLSLAVLLMTRKGFTLLSRANRTDAFANPSQTSFSNINALGQESPPEQAFGDPVFSADGTTLVFSIFGGTLDATLHVSSRSSSSDPWPTGDVLSQAELNTLAGSRRIPTGYSSDGLTLFYWDEVSVSQKAAWRIDTSSPFSQFIDLGPRIFAQPSAGCSMLYYSFATPTDGGNADAGAGSLTGLDLVVAPLN